MNITERVALVTGAGSGIGRGPRHSSSPHVGPRCCWWTGMRPPPPVTMRMPAPGSIDVATCDVTDGDGSSAVVFDHAVARFGRLDIVANVAGIGDSDLFVYDPGPWRRVIDIDLTAVIDGTRLAVRLPCDTKATAAPSSTWHRSSASTLPPSPPSTRRPKPASSCSPDHSHHSWTNGGIRVNAICPELVDTPLAAAGMGEERWRTHARIRQRAAPAGRCRPAGRTRRGRQARRRRTATHQTDGATCVD